MLARRHLPDSYLAWNRAHGAPYGRRRPPLFSRLSPRTPLLARYAGPYAWQTNNSTRAFEYPWVCDQIAQIATKKGRPLRIVDVGGSTAGLQFTLARSGHFVHNVDPGLKATGKGWAVDDKFHHFLATVYRAPVSLHCTTLPGAGFAERSIDVVVSVSAIEHFSQQDIEDFAREARRLLFPGGYVVLTVDLFLDLIPFSARLSNVFGINVSVAGVIESLGAQIVVGDRAELYGFPEFDAQLIQSRLAEFLIGDPYPALTQCVVACLE